MALRVRGLVFGLLLLAGTSRAEMLVLRGPSGQLYITNRGEKSGYKVISRFREFSGSSGLGLRSAREGDPTPFEPAIRQAAEKYAVEATLVKAVIRAESNFEPRAISIKGAMGLMQLMPDTARLHEVRNAYDPVENIHGGVRHLRYLMNRYKGKLDLVLAAYNAGTKPVDEVNGIPAYAETREYVRRVHEFHARYRAAEMKRLPARPIEALAKLDIKSRTADELYGVPIVLRDTRSALAAH